jgi:hypothetical protein
LPSRFFYVDRIIDHRSLDPPEAFAPEILDYSSDTPGIPTDAFPPVSFLFDLKHTAPSCSAPSILL